jgi:iron complex outermembrane recepter protein
MEREGTRVVGVNCHKIIGGTMNAIQLSRASLEQSSNLLKRSIQLAIAASSALAGTVSGQSVESRALEEVVVTAQKRSQTAQEVPMSISVLSAETIQIAGLTNFNQYAEMIPNLTFSYSSGQGVTTSRAIAIRGIQGAGTTGFYIDDIPLLAGVDPYSLDLSRVEVLRGPQGTLYGARSMGGTMRLITREPALGSTDVSTHAQLSTVENGGDGYQVDATASVGIGESVAMRISGFSLSHGGFVDRRFPDSQDPSGFSSVDDVARQDMVGGSVSFLWKATDNFIVRPMFLYQKSERNGLPLGDIYAGNKIQQRLFDIPEEANDEWMLSGLSMTWQTPYGDIVSATSYFDRDVDELEECSDWTAAILGYSPAIATAIPVSSPQRQFVQELRFASEFSGDVQVVTGLYYSDGKQGFESNWIVPGIDEANGGAFGTDLAYLTDNPRYSREKAAFGELTYSFAEQWEGTIGVRYSDSWQRVTRASDGIFNGGASYFEMESDETSVTPKAVLAFKPSDSQTYYALASKGFRPGGPNSPLPGCDADLAALGLTAEQASSFKSDSLWNYELGAKLENSDGRLSVRGALFYIDWNDTIQEVRLPTCGFTFRGNVGSARSQGGELEIVAAPIDGLTMTAGIGYTDAEITGSAPGVAAQPGDPVQQVAPWTGTASGQYEFPLTTGLNALIRADISYTDRSFSASVDQFNPRVREAYELANLRLGVVGESWQALLFVENLTNERPNLADNQSQAAELDGRPRIMTTLPRTYGVEVRYRF